MDFTLQSYSDDSVGPFWNRPWSWGDKNINESLNKDETQGCGANKTRCLLSFNVQEELICIVCEKTPGEGICISL